MTKLCRGVVFTMCAYSLSSIAQTSSDCPGAKGISDDEAVAIAKRELARRQPDFDPSKHTFSVKKDNCDLRIAVEQKGANQFGGGSVVVLDRSGKVKQYIGGF